MNEQRQNTNQRNSTNHNFILKSNSCNTNWIVDPFTQVKVAEDIKFHKTAVSSSEPSVNQTLDLRSIKHFRIA